MLLRGAIEGVRLEKEPARAQHSADTRRGSHLVPSAHLVSDNCHLSSGYNVQGTLHPPLTTRYSQYPAKAVTIIPI